MTHFFVRTDGAPSPNHIDVVKPLQIDKLTGIPSVVPIANLKDGMKVLVK
jgi:hypothetical protein